MVTTTGTDHAAAVQIEPQYRTRIKSYVTEHHLRPITTKEKIIVGAPVPGDVELEAVPSDRGPLAHQVSLRVFRRSRAACGPGSRTVVQEID
ncbi:DUF1236 domain-containing protein [Bradyrhizobium sp. ERR14]|uniref:DUF1236 domain-containing protein n=1 Tax=Bradyrhizobium sp. ERR14 TaxID=2663837 RepID=UPI001610B487|nr:DUF1236 domain-containing protein [Bradyrhizobium sp. ERR14]MBB4395014.1 hypothetical protein [Bradyrhizobium sp. ERR14]